MTMRALVTLGALALLACERPDGTSTTGPPAAAGPSAPAAERRLTNEARAAMAQELAGEGGARRAWIMSQPGDPEVAALVSSLTAVFEGAGWTVQAETVSGMSLKPGVVTLVAEEQYPPYVDSVLRALEASGLGAKSASGYRPYYESKKQENPSWPGVPMRADQDFVIVVGPKPRS
jgi:hypothetical protein